MTSFDPDTIASSDELGDLSGTAQLGNPELVAGQCNGFLSLAVQEWNKAERVTSYAESFARALGNLANNHAWRPLLETGMARLQTYVWMQERLDLLRARQDIPVREGTRILEEISAKAGEISALPDVAGEVEGKLFPRALSKVLLHRLHTSLRVDANSRIAFEK